MSDTRNSSASAQALSDAFAHLLADGVDKDGVETARSITSSLRLLTEAFDERTEPDEGDTVATMVRRRVESGDVDDILRQAEAVFTEAQVAKSRWARAEWAAEVVGRLAKALALRGLLGL